jgi:hypothetical protein
MELLQSKYYTRGIFICVMSIISYHHLPKIYKYLKKNISGSSPVKKEEIKHVNKVKIYNFEDDIDIDNDDYYFNDNYSIGLPIEHLYYNSDNDEIFS